MKKIKYLFLSLMLMPLLTGCSFLDSLFGKGSKEIQIEYVFGDKTLNRTYKSYDTVSFESYSTTTGYDFKGWSFDKDGTVITKEDLKGKTKVTLYPVIDLTKYIITYELDGGVNNSSNPNYYTIESEIDIQSPTKTDFAFVGWTTDTITTPTQNYKIEKGSYGDITLTANYIHGKVNVIFYGYEDLNQVIDYNSTCTKPANPTKFGDTFLYWCTDPSLDASTEFDFTTPLTESITLYPKWNNTVFYTLTIENSELIDSNYSNGTKLPKDVVVDVRTDYVVEGYEFLGWYIDDELYSRNYKLSVTMPSSNLKITPMFNSIDTFEYYLNSNTNLYTGITKTGDGSLVGSNVYNNYGHEENKLYIASALLETLTPGIHSFMYEDRLIINVFVKVQNKDVTNIYVDYDTNYPKATLYFDCFEGYDYSYSLDGASYKPCSSGELLTISNKLISHSIDVKCEDGSPVHYVIEAIPVSAQSYLDDEFTYQGHRYDHYVETDSDLKAILEYYIYSKYPSTGETEYSFNFFNNVSGDLSSKCQQIIRRELSIPYGLAYGVSTTGHVATVSLESSGVFNTLKTSQTRSDLEHTQFLPSYRSSTYNDFYIEKCNLTQDIRSIYELETLNIDVKPNILDSKAQILYNKAKKILREYVGDYMTDIEKVNAIYDYLATYVTYDDVLLTITTNTSDYQSFTAYSALVEGIAVCDGIASAFKLLCTMEGIECIEVIGSAENGGHAWNKVKIGNVWYGVDATWSRTTLYDSESVIIGKYVSHRYFMINEIGLKTIGNCHYEQGELVGGYIRNYNVDITSNSSLTYYDLKMYGNYDLVCSSKLEYKEMYYVFKNNEVNYVELELKGITSTAIIQANSELITSIYSIYSSESDPYHVTLVRK